VAGLESIFIGMIIKFATRFTTFLLLVDKVVIDQESFSRLINTIYPGAYSSMTKISFSSLDKFRLRPTGVYGSKAEIAKLLRSLGIVDDELFVLIFIYGKYRPDRRNHPELKSLETRRTPA
jgi:hypothetical protein